MDDSICIVEGCSKPVRVKMRGWCAMHYRRWQVYGFLDKPLCVCEVCGSTFESYNRTTRFCSRKCARQPTMDRHLANCRAYHAKRKAEGWKRQVTEKDRERTRRWKQANPERVRALNAKRNAIKKGATVELVEPQVLWDRDRGVCGICGLRCDPADFHVDHIVPLASGGEHSYANTHIAHPACNLKKGTRPLCPQMDISVLANSPR